MSVGRRHRGFGDAYTVGELLGEGSYGCIFEAVSKNSEAKGGAESERAGQRMCAVKVFRLDGPSRADAERRKSFEVESRFLGLFDHPNVLKMYEFFTANEVLCLVLEHCGGGDLFSRILDYSQEHGSGFDEPLARVLFLQLLCAVAYLHGLRIVHCDLKPENILLMGAVGTAQADDLRICDFGSCVELTDSKPRSTGRSGTLCYAAPEAYDDRGVSLPADMWSLGTILYVLTTGTNPFQLITVAANVQEDIVARVRAGAYDQQRSQWVQTSVAAKGLVRRLLVVDEERRDTPADAMRHPWLAGGGRKLCDDHADDPPDLVEHAQEFLSWMWRYSSLPLAHRLALVGCGLAATHEDIDRCRINCRDLFFALDLDRDGRLGFAELADGLAQLLPDMSSPRLALEDRARALDVNQSGKVDWAEFVAVALLPLAGELSEAVEPTSSAVNTLASPPENYRRIPAARSGRTHGEVITHWAARERLESGCPPEQPKAEKLPTEESLRSVLASAHSLARAHRWPGPPEMSPIADDSIRGLSICAVTSELLVVCGAVEGDGAVAEWNAACAEQGDLDKELRLDTIIASIGRTSLDSRGMLAVCEKTIFSHQDDVRQANFVSFVPKAFRVTVNKRKGHSLGIQFKQDDAFEFGLVIESLGDGLLKEWNNVHTEACVHAGQLIVGVCGRRGRRQDLLDLLAQAQGTDVCLSIVDLTTLSL